MPHVRRSMLITVDADAERIRRSLVDDLGLAADKTGFTGPDRGDARHDPRLEAVIVTDGAAPAEVRLVAVSDVVVPFFTWFLRIQAWLGARSALPTRPLGSGPRRPMVPPRARSSCSRSSRRCRSPPSRRPGWAALAAVALLANFCGALLSQNGDAVTSAFDRSDEALGAALAVARAGVLVSLVAIALGRPVGAPPSDPGRADRRLRGQCPDARSHPPSRCSPARSC